MQIIRLEAVTAVDMCSYIEDALKGHSSDDINYVEIRAAA